MGVDTSLCASLVAQIKNSNARKKVEQNGSGETYSPGQFIL
jgi:hypothetical protein